MMRKALIPLTLLGIALLVVIVLHVLSTFSSFTMFGLEEEQYKALISDAIFVLALIYALVPLLQTSKKTLKFKEAQYKSLVSDVIFALTFCFALIPLLETTRNRRKLQQEDAKTLIMDNRCFRCGHKWRPKNIDVASSVCPNCYSPYWDRPRRKRQNSAI